jgi:hypothetical protein
MAKCQHVRHSRKAWLAACAATKVLMTVKVRTKRALGIIDVNDPHMSTADYRFK